MSRHHDMAERILDAALEQAESSSWEAVTFFSIAQTLDISLQEIKNYYPQKDDLVEAWFDRADKAILCEKFSPQFSSLSARQRVHKVIMLWFLALSKHRKVTRQMLYYKLEPGHIHLQVLGVLRISRTVQWFREAAILETKNIHRIIEELCLTSIYLTSFARWLCDDSKDSIKTDRYILAMLKRIKSLNSSTIGS